MYCDCWVCWFVSTILPFLKCFEILEICCRTCCVCVVYMEGRGGWCLCFVLEMIGFWCNDIMWVAWYKWRWDVGLGVVLMGRMDRMDRMGMIGWSLWFILNNFESSRVLFIVRIEGLGLLEFRKCNVICVWRQLFGGGVILDSEDVLCFV